MTDYEGFSKCIIDGVAPIEKFCRGCEELTSAKIVTAERKIGELLKIIATSSLMQEIVKRSVVGFDFSSSLSTARIKTGEKFSLVTPISRSEFIAFGVNLLYAIDTKAIPLPEFLEYYYFSGNGATFAFQLFVQHIMFPLRDAFIAEAQCALSQAQK